MMMRICLILIVLLTTAPLQALAFDQGYTLWNTDLSRFNDKGYVHYGAWQRDQAGLKHFLQQLKGVTVQDFSSWTPAQREAMWINAYNALVISDLIQAYPNVDRVKERRYSVAGQRVRSSEIRDKILRGSETRVPFLSEALMRDTSISAGSDLRVLFALCDGSTATPRLAPSAYRAEGLSEQLDAQVRRTLADSDFMRVDPRLRIFHAAGFFRSYQKDFKTFRGNSLLFERSSSSDRGLLRFIFPYLDKGLQDKIMSKQKSSWRVDYRLSARNLNGGD